MTQVSDDLPGVTLNRSDALVDSPLSQQVPDDLPGADLISAGVEDLRRGRFTVEALLVAVGAHRLRAAGLPVPTAPGWPKEPEFALYDAIGRAGVADSHAHYNSLIRRLVSFERALEARQSRAGRAMGSDAASPSGS